MAATQLMYRNKTLSVAVGTFCLLGTGIFIGEALNPGKGGLGLTVFAAITAVGAGALAARTLVAPTLTAAHNGVRIRTLLRTRNYSWSEIERFEVVVRQVRAYNRKVLTIALRNGQTRSFNELNSSPAKVGWVEDAAATLNQYLAALRGSGASIT